MRSLSGVLVLVLATAVPALADNRLDEAVKKAEEQIRKGRPEEAVKGLQKLAKQQPDSIEVHLALGRVLFRTGSRDEAGPVYTRATDLAGSSTGPVAASAYGALAGYELMRGSAARALELAEAAVKADASAETLAVLAQAQARTGDALQALRTSEKAVAAGPGVALAYQARALALATLDRLDEAVVASRKAVELAPQSVGAQVSLAFMLVLQGRPQEAVAVAQAAKEVDAKPAPEAYAVLGLAMAKANAKDWGAAIGEVQEGALFESSERPRSPLILYCRGQLFEIRGDIDQAIADYREATNIDPQFGPTSYALVFALYQKGDPAGALVEARRLAKTAPKNGQLQHILGELLIRRDEFEEALAPLEKAIVLLPNSPTAHYFLGLARERTGGEPPDVAKLYCRASSLNPSQAEYRVQCGFWLVRADQVPAGIEQLVKVVSDPAYKGPEAWIALGYAYANSDPPKYAEAADAYKRAVTAVDPSKAAVKTQALFGLARALDKAKRVDDAIAAYGELARHDPSYGAVAATRIAWIEFQREEPTKDFARTEAALTRLASVAGADNSAGASIRARMESARKGDKKATEGPDEDFCEPNACIRILQGQAAAAAKIRAVSDLRNYGRDGAQWIGSYALFYQKDIAVREAAINALIAMKGLACAAIREIKGVAAIEVVPSPSATRQEVERELRLLDVIKKARNLRDALAGSCK